MSYDRTTTRLVEKNCLGHRLFTKPAPTTPPPAATTAATSRERSAGSAA